MDEECGNELPKRQYGHAKVVTDGEQLAIGVTFDGVDIAAITEWRPDTCAGAREEQPCSVKLYNFTTANIGPSDVAIGFRQHARCHRGCGVMI